MENFIFCAVQDVSKKVLRPKFQVKISSCSRVSVQRKRQMHNLFLSSKDILGTLRIKVAWHQTEGNIILEITSGCAFIFGSLCHFNTKCDRCYYKSSSCFTTKCGKSLLKNILVFLLQNATDLLQNATGFTKCTDFITKCKWYYKIRRFLQNASVHC